MHIRVSIFFALLFAFIGCSSSTNTLRIRAVAPTIDEAFRKLSLAVNVDGYEIERMDAAHFIIETQWRDAKEQEKLASEKTLSAQVKVNIALARRGQSYDVFVSPSIKVGNLITEPTVGNPLLEKWKRIVNSIVQKESREED
jgi:hypothetical protein